MVPQAEADGVYQGASTAFQRLSGLLAQSGIRFEQVIRTWLYLGGIVDDEGPTQRYKELNRPRTDFFQDIAFLDGRQPPGRRGPAYPASTGIGTEGRGIMMSAIALVTERSDILAVPLENPRQVAAFDYGAHYSPASPKFSRAMALSCGTYATIFVSGTASITNSETRHVGDAAAQTHETLDNIAALISEENLAAHGLPGLGTSLDGLAFVRVYVKRREDYGVIRAACQRRLGEACRPSMRWPTFAGRSCWSRSRAWPLPKRPPPRRPPRRTAVPATAARRRSPADPQVRVPSPSGRGPG